jgi:hypothetical protein
VCNTILLNVVIQWLALLLYIHKILRSKTEPRDRLSWLRYLWFSLVIPGTGYETKFFSHSLSFSSENSSHLPLVCHKHHTHTFYLMNGLESKYSVLSVLSLLTVLTLRVCMWEEVACLCACNRKSQRNSKLFSAVNIQPNDDIFSIFFVIITAQIHLNY